MKIILTTDSTSDLPKNIFEKENISVIPLNVNLEDETFEDGINIGPEQIFEFVDKTKILPKTGARSAYSYKEFFESCLKQYNADAIIHIALSNELSSSHDNALIAANELGNVKVVNTLSLSSGCGLLALSAADKIKAGKNLDEIISELEEERNKIQASFVVDSLDYLYKGGRCSALSLFGANILRIKPKIKLTNGKLGVDKKYMGKFEQVVLSYVSDLIKTYPNANKNRVFITYTTRNDELVLKIRNKLENAGFKEIIENSAGSTIASHCGRNTLGVLFMDL